MNARILLFGRLCVAASMLGMCPGVQGESMAQPLVRIAELEIDSAQLDRYKSALKEEIEASIRLEPGVLTLYAVSLKDRPAEIRIFETYADQAAYQAHVQTPHFKKYKNETQHMVKSLRLIETDPVLLGAKPGGQ